VVGNQRIIDRRLDFPNFYGVGKLEDLCSALADKVLRRLMEMRRNRARDSTTQEQFFTRDARSPLHWTPQSNIVSEFLLLTIVCSGVLEV
jgi:hypothetical protein